MQYNVQTITQIENLIKDSSGLFQNKPKRAIELSTKALQLSEGHYYKNGIVKAKIILAKANLFKGNIEAALKFSEDCISLFDEGINLPLEYAELMRYLAIIYYKQHDYDSSYQFAYKSLIQYKALDDKNSMVKSLDLLGNIYTKQQEYPAAFSHFHKCLELKRELKINAESISVTLSNLGLLFMDMKDYEKSEKYMLQAKTLLQDNDEAYFKMIVLQNLGVIYGKMDNLDKSIKTLIESLKISQKNHFYSSEASILSNLSEFCYYNGALDQSIQYAIEGISICDSLSVKNNIYATCLVNVFRCHHASGELEIAASVGKDCMPLCFNIGYDDLAIDLCKELIQVLEKLGRIHEAFDISKELIRLQNESYKKKCDFGIFKVQSKLEVQMKEQELEMQRGMIAQQERYNKELTAANNELDGFVGMASHDLKEPIRTINSFSEVLGKYFIPGQKEYQFLNLIQEAGQRMDILIDDLLAFARAGKITTAPQSVSLMDSMFLVEQNLYSSISATETILIYENLPTIEAHRTPIIQVLQNIISNAIKYSKDDVPPVIRISAHVSNEETIVTIADNGLGIDADKVDKIFHPFIRVHGKLDKKGSGIGLATCRKTIERYGGTIWATSEVGVGTNIYFSIPLSNHLSDN